MKAKRFLQPIINNLNELQVNGLFINGNHLKFTFSTMVADNLAAHLIGGFQMSFNNGYFCRRCYIKSADRNLPISMTKADTRTCIDYDKFVEKVIRNPYESPLMGINEKSALEGLIGFHPIMSLPGDLMHDYIEGICPLVMMALLKQASSMRLVTYAGIQKRMEKFQYGYFDCRNRPPPILVKHMQNDRISATAAQKLCLFRLFPIIFNDFIHDVPSMIVYKQLREILDLVLSIPFRKQWIPVLRDLCIGFHESMLLYFHTKMVPKIHFVCEYDKIINDYGPSIRQWCFRYEGCHAYFKKIALRSNNFKNVPKMLATRYCLKQAFKLSQLNRMKNLHYAVRITNTQRTSFTTQIKNILLDHFGRINPEKDLIQCNKLFHENVEYYRSSVYVLDLRDPDEQPIFAQIIYILKNNEKWWFIIDTLETIGYDESLCSWEVKSMDRFSLMDPHHMKYYYKGLDIYELKNSKNEIDGPTLELMNSVEKITTFIPKFKQQLLFLNEREKLFNKSNDNLTQPIVSSSASSNLNLSSSSSSSTLSSFSESISERGSKEFINSATSESDQSLIVQEKNALFPDKYVIPPLPNALLKDIQNGALNKFGPHYSNRQILIEAVANDLIDKYNMFYPTHKQFQVIGEAIVECLKLPLIQENIAIWKDALQTKLKRKRFENRNNNEVEHYQLKYSRIGSGRPVKKRIGEIAQKDRQKQIMQLTYDDATLQNIQTKAEKLRDESDLDIHAQLHLWQETVHFRRQCIREKPTSEILQEFPDYSNQLLIFEEVKMTTTVDLSSAIRRQIPILLEKGFSAQPRWG
ncbi:unnamed protein product [Rotaria magnacalcarata]